jgi:hypothetical protein
VKVLIFVIVIFSFLRAGQAANMKWDFESDSADQSPTGFTFGKTGSGRVGRWLIKSEKAAPSGVNVLAQTDPDTTSYRFPVAIVDSVSARNVRVSVLCKPLAGKVDQACGLVFRFGDENNYYVVRGNALENNVRLYYVKNGQRQQVAGWDGPVASGVWHSLNLEAREDSFEIYWNGQKVIVAHDATFKEAGKVGLWTKADSITYFDDLNVDSLDSK